MLTQSYLRELFDYCDGYLHCKNPTSSKIKIGDKIGSNHPQGYLKTKIYGKEYLVHRLIFMWNYNYLPKFLDHIDGNRLNNLIENLRPATSSENNKNAKLKKNNTSGYKNVSWRKDTKTWTVILDIDGKPKRFGNFKDIELADLVAQEARNKYYKEWANHG